MGAFKNLIIKWKLVFILVSVTFLNLITLSAFLINKGIDIFKENMVRNFDVLAEAVGSISRASIIFDDPETGKRILLALGKEKQIAG